MCQIFISADPQLYDSRARSVRLHGVATSLRLENFFWQVLEEIAGRDGLSVPQLCTRLYDELVQERGAVDNFTSFLRVCCGRYLALQLAGGIPPDTRVAIRSLNPQAVLARERTAQAALQPA
ncbi:ribbon-helix-helix domain-containing protein [Comamonas flocculans]|uniref:Ribbon-helix-helix domain-containing protein n=1 Tax=Comamonas flocculans TaxID=2597701 RepID=A0A5B8RSP9_9BURK|nr:ribbon-helix-helix domain-containing protein [Comamonas flocculans]QEA12689.1 ribbon-helix-helix domain-containing protein [Comamonas flocculans]